MLPCGFLNVHKPIGITSRDVVNRVQRLARRLKAGHAGTLDPLASGVLVVCLGAATRLANYVQAMPKGYRGTFLLGRQSPTEDVDGPVTELPDPPIPTLDQLRAAAASLTGEILQRPPAFSALKIGGRRAYDLARAGEQVNLEPRPITVYQIEVERYDYPELGLAIECSSGTYVRSLGRDLAASLGTAAVMSQLTRTAIGSFSIEEAVLLDSLHPDNWTEYLLPPLRAVETLPRMALSDVEIGRLHFGQTIAKHVPHQGAAEVAGISPGGQLAAILTPRDRDLWQAVWKMSQVEPSGGWHAVTQP
jgi:tRNA pseudouridine55 synthase